MTDQAPPQQIWPHWVQELHRSLILHSQVAFAGNIHDVFLVRRGNVDVLFPLHHCLWEALRVKGYELLILFDRVSGIRPYPDDEERRESLGELLGKDLKGGQLEVTLEQLPRYFSRAVFAKSQHVAFVIDYASRLVEHPENLSPAEHYFFLSCEKLSHEAHPVLRPGDEHGPLFNPILWLLKSERDIPHWLTAGNEKIRSIPIPKPDQDARRRAGAYFVPRLPGCDRWTDSEREAVLKLSLSTLRDSLSRA